MPYPHLNMEAVLKEDPESFKSYFKRLQYHFKANNITDGDMKKAIMCSTAGDMLFRQIMKLCKPKDVDDVSYKEICEKLNKHYDPEICKFSRIVQFRERKQKEGESFKQYLAELRLLVEGCGYADVDAELLAQVLTGLREERFVTKLLNVEELTLVRAEKLLNNYEDALKAVGVMYPRASASGTADTAASTVHWAGNNAKNNKHGKNSSHSKEEEGQCYRCNGDHNPYDCNYMHSMCNYCQRYGHIQKACRTKKFNEARSSNHDGQSAKNGDDEGTPAYNKKQQHHPARGRGRGGQNHKNQVHHFTESQAPRSLFFEPQEENGWQQCAPSLHHIKSVSDEKSAITCTPTVEGVQLKMQVDSGSHNSVIGLEDYINHFHDHKLDKSDQYLTTWGESNKNTLQVYGVFHVNVVHNNHKSKLPLHVLREDGPALLGRAWFSALGIGVTVSNPDSEQTNPVSTLTPRKSVSEPLTNQSEGVPTSTVLTPKSVTSKAGGLPVSPRAFRSNPEPTKKKSSGRGPPTGFVNQRAQGGPRSTAAGVNDPYVPSQHEPPDGWSSRWSELSGWDPGTE